MSDVRMRRDKPSSEPGRGEEYPGTRDLARRSSEKSCVWNTKAPENARAGGPSQLTQLTQLTGPSLSHKSTAPLSYDTQAR